ncbi:hypothetical protein C7271_03460 [filamentous cyanobacterium CCP5]|nr:hypothetical protein C7271_03460 [filamentous cyanobacterium CCP5]
MKGTLNITQKFIGFLLLTSILPLFTISILSYQAARKTLESEAIRYSEEIVVQKQEYLELQLEQIEGLITNISGVDEIIEVLEQERTQTDTYTNLVTQARIGYILSSHSSLKGLVSIDIFTMQGARYHVGDTLDVSDIRHDVKNKILIQALQNNRTIAWYGVGNNINASSTEDKVITAAKMIHKTDAETLTSMPIAMLLVNYSLDAIYDSFDQVDLGTNAHLLVLDGENRVIYHPDRQLAGLYASEALIQHLGASEPTFATNINGERMLVTFVQSEMSGWKILSLIPTRNLALPSSTIRMAIGLALLISLLIVAISAWLITLQFVRPIRQITQRFKLFQSASDVSLPPLAISNRDEIGELSRWFNVFLVSWEGQQQAEAALRESAEQQQAILRVVERMRQTLDLDEIFDVTTNELKRLLKCDRIIIFRNHPDGGLECLAEAKSCLYDSWLPAKTGSQVLALESSLKLEPPSPHFTAPTGPVAASAVDQWASQLTPQGPSHLDQPPAIANLGVKSYLHVPILRNDQTWGMIGAYQHSQPQPWKETDINLVTSVSSQLGIALQQADLFAKIRQQAADLEQAKNTAEAANMAKSNFLANMSHELRTPLNAILGFTEILAEDSNLSLSQHESLSIINHSGEHLLELINDVLNMAKIESGKISLQEVCFDLYEFLSKLENLFRLNAKIKQLDLNFILHPELPRHICSDEGKLRQILTNLLGNAVKFTQTGRITLEVSTISSPDKHGPQSFDCMDLRFTVTDTGPGISASELDSIFEPFVQSETGRLAQEGTGLGLTIIRRLLQAMGGAIQVKSEVNIGTRFDVVLPVKAAAPEEAPPQTDPISLEDLTVVNSSYRILVVDDAPTNRMVLRHILGSLGLEVREAENGQAAIQIWQEWAPHLVLMDMKMPIMDGYLTTRMIRQLESQFATTHVPTKIIAVTAQAFEDDQRQVLESGCDDFLSKPLKREMLLEKLAVFLGLEGGLEGVHLQAAQPSAPKS